MRITAYLQDPCGASSLPLWKTERVSVPENMAIIREDGFTPEDYRDYEDSPYFKLLYKMDAREKPILREGFRLAACDMVAFARHIRACYGAGPSEEELSAYKIHPVYCADLWVAVAEENSGQIVASGIGELDTRIGEGILEWIQVSPKYRRLGLGSFVVKELLWRLRDTAAFVTVSGRMENETNPFALYRSCGFSNSVVWHVLTKKDHIIPAKEKNC